MTEYWVSQAKHFCKFCNCWITDNKASRQFHETSQKHKFSVQRFNKEKREKNLHGARSEHDLRQQLYQIDKAAHSAISSDRANDNGTFYANARRPGVGTSLVSQFRASSSSSSSPFPGPQSSSYQGGESRSADDHAESDRLGMYEVRGQHYLEGTVHENKIVSGVKCEIFVEDYDDWYPASVVSRRVVNVPHTALTMKVFTVQYQRPKDPPPPVPEDDDDNNEEATTSVAALAGTADVTMVPITEHDVTSDRIRLLVSKDGIIQFENTTAVDFNAVAPDAVAHLNAIAAAGGSGSGSGPAGSAATVSATASKPIGPPAPVIASTGLGGWQTVSVSVFDEEEVEKERQRKEREENLEARRVQQQQEAKKRKAEEVEEAVRDSGDVLSSYDPYRTNIYKGFNIGNSDSSAADAAAGRLSKGAIVGFKKRKPSASSGSGNSSSISSDGNGISSSSSTVDESEPSSASSRADGSLAHTIDSEVIEHKVLESSEQHSATSNSSDDQKPADLQQPPPAAPAAQVHKPIAFSLKRK